MGSAGAVIAGAFYSHLVEFGSVHAGAAVHGAGG
jgi:hypothetical protein